MMKMWRCSLTAFVAAVGFGFVDATVWGQCETAKLVPIGGAVGDQFGSSVGISGDTLIVGVPIQATSAGAAYLYVRQNGQWIEQAKLLDPLAAQGFFEFGRAVSVSGDFVAVGAPKTTVSVASRGVVHMFRRSGTAWTLEQFQLPTLISTTSGVGVQFGASVSVDGDAVLIGAPTSDEIVEPAGIGDSGSAYVMRRGMDGVWRQEAKLLADDAAELDLFGSTVLLRGNTAFVTAFGDKDPQISASNTIGSVYVFNKQGSSWVQTQKLVPSDAAAQAALGARNFGRSLDSDGSVLIVGERSGQSAYVFRFNGGAWVEEAILKKPAVNTGSDQFGNSVAISGDIAMVGAPLDDDNSLTNSGTVFAFRRVGQTWINQSLIYASDPTASARFGISLAIDDSFFVAGAIEATTGPGSAHIFATIIGDDCNFNGISDECDLHSDPSTDANGNGILDVCECDQHSQCVDPYPCTLDYCDFASGRCRHDVDLGHCLIGGLCITDGVPSPDNPCHACDHALDSRDWSALPEQTECPDDGNECTFDVCISGACQHPLAKGQPCGDPTATACDLPDMCSDLGICSSNPALVGTGCDDGVFCNGDDYCDGAGGCFSPGDPCITTSRPFCDEINHACLQCLGDLHCNDNNGCTTDTCVNGGDCIHAPVMIGIPCGDSAAAECSLPDFCNTAGACAPNHLLDGAPCSPDADPCTFDVCVGGACVHSYESPTGDCGAADCNCNGVADSCDIVVGTSNDCDGNETPDECELPLFRADSGQLSPIGTGFPQRFMLVSPPRATENVTLAFAARGDFLALTEKVAVSINGVAMGEVLGFSGLDCPIAPDEDTLIVTAALFNQAVAGGDATIDLIASAAVDAALCLPPSWISVTITYRGVQTNDCNGNGEPDECEMQSDCNYNGVPDICDPDCDGDGVPDACALYTYPYVNDEDCNYNGIPDRCDILEGTSSNCNANWIPDECESDCQGNSIPDECDIASGTSLDCNDDQVPDECLFPPDEFTSPANVVSTDGVVALGVYKGGHFSHRATVYRWNGTAWMEESHWGPSTGNRFFSGAIENNLAVVTEYHFQSDPWGLLSQPAKVFRLINGIWQLDGELSSDLDSDYVSYGTSVDVSGNVVVVGEPSADQLLNSGQHTEGAVHVFRRNPEGWQREVVLLSSSAGEYVSFGASVALDGNWLAVGAPNDTANGIDFAGSVSLFHYESNQWILHQKLTLPGNDLGYQFGEYLALDGNGLVVGCPGCHWNDIPGAGAVYVYHFSGETWEYESTLTPPMPQRYARFGGTLSLDGSNLLVCAPREPLEGTLGGASPSQLANGQTVANTSAKFYQGVTYVFRMGGGVWRQEFRLPMERLNISLAPGAILAVGSNRALITDNLWGNVRTYDLNGPDCHCPEAAVVLLNPQHGAVDARQPFDLITPGTSQGIIELQMHGPNRASLACWTTTESPPETPPLKAVEDWQNGNGTMTLELSRPPAPGSAVAVTYSDINGQSITGLFTSHPANVDGGPFADADDVLTHQQCCLGASTCGPLYDPYRCDIDHSQTTTAEDLIRVIDLLNGAGAFSPYLGTPLPPPP